MVNTQVAIIGAGPAGLMLAHMLHLRGIESIVIELRDMAHAMGRIRAGVLEQGTVDILNNTGVGERLRKEGMPHDGIDFGFAGERHRINVRELTDGKVVTVYGQTEIVKDLIDARLAYNGEILFESKVTSIENSTNGRPQVNYKTNNKNMSIQCDFIAACDGFHGIGRQSLPADLLKIYDNEYPYSWLGILAEAAPVNDCVLYSRHDDGFALSSMRSPEVSRLYLQVSNSDHIDNWTDKEIWDALDKRLYSSSYTNLVRGTIVQRGITPMRSFVAEPMSHQRLFLAGDAAHIVPPTGAKGLNLAIADSTILASALINHYAANDDTLLEDYSDVCLRRVWMVERFSWWCTSATHINHHESEFEQRIHNADLDLLISSRTYAKVFAENYTGLPIEHIPDF